MLRNGHVRFGGRPAETHPAQARQGAAGRPYTQWATTPYTEAGLVRLVLNPVVVGATFTAATALEVLRGLRALPLHRFLADDSSLAAPHIDVAALVGHRQVTDYHLVNLVARKGAQLATFDSRLVASLAPEDRRHVTIIPA